MYVCFEKKKKIIEMPVCFCCTSLGKNSYSSIISINNNYWFLSFYSPLDCKVSEEKDLVPFFYIHKTQQGTVGNILNKLLLNERISRNQF